MSNIGIMKIRHMVTMAFLVPVSYLTLSAMGGWEIFYTPGAKCAPLLNNENINIFFGIPFNGKFQIFSTYLGICNCPN